MPTPPAEIPAPVAVENGKKKKEKSSMDDWKIISSTPKKEYIYRHGKTKEHIKLHPNQNVEEGKTYWTATHHESRKRLSTGRSRGMAISQAISAYDKLKRGEDKMDIKIIKAMIVDKIVERLKERTSQIRNSVDAIEEAHQSDLSDSQLEEASRADCQTSGRLNNISNIKKSSIDDEAANLYKHDRKYNQWLDTDTDLHKGMKDETGICVYSMAMESTEWKSKMDENQSVESCHYAGQVDIIRPGDPEKKEEKKNPWKDELWRVNFAHAAKKVADKLYDKNPEWRKKVKGPEGIREMRAMVDHWADVYEHQGVYALEEIIGDKKKEDY